MQKFLEDFLQVCQSWLIFVVAGISLILGLWIGELMRKHGMSLEQRIGMMILCFYLCIYLIFSYGEQDVDTAMHTLGVVAGFMLMGVEISDRILPNWLFKSKWK